MTTGRKIVLIGPMGAGKTSLGKRLAARLRWDFVDTDHALCARTGVDIPTIFAQEGEAGFRKREHTTLAAELADPRERVVACGGGIVINADKVVLTGKKWDDRVYLKFSGYPGGQRSFSPRFLQAKGSDRLFRKVVKGMLPKNRLGAAILANLYVYDGAEHKHQAQQPRLVDLNTLK